MTNRNAARRLCFHCTSRDARLSAAHRWRASACAVFLTLCLSFGGSAFAADPPAGGMPPTPPSTLPATPIAAPPPAATAPALPPDYHDAASSVDVYESLNDDMFPSDWHDPDVAVAALPLPAEERARALRLVKAALSKYPAELVKANLERVYLVGGLKFEGIEAAATNSATCLYIEDEGLSAKDNAGHSIYTDRFIEDSFHHEFAHLLQRNYADQWSAPDWAACNPGDFRYGAINGVEAVRAGHDSEEPTDDLNRRGFLCEYGESDAAEDFATLAAGLFIGDSDYWNRLDRFPVLKAKADKITGFYAKLDKRFTETYFRELRPGLAYVAPPAPATASTDTGIATVTPPQTAPAEPAASAKPDSTTPAAKP